MKTHKVEEEFQYRNCWSCRAVSLDIGRTPAVHLCSIDGTVIGGNYEACTTVCDNWRK